MQSIMISELLVTLSEISHIYHQSIAASLSTVNNSKTILAVVLLMAGTLLTITAVNGMAGHIFPSCIECMRGDMARAK
jgi:hypothetical protein